MQLRVFIILFLTFLINGSLLAQSEEVSSLDTFSREPIPILLNAMQFPTDVPPALVERLRQVTGLSFERHWHFDVINHSSAQNDGSIDPEYVVQLTLLPLVDNMSKVSRTDSLGPYFYYSLSQGIEIDIRVTDIVTGEVVSNRTPAVTASGVAILRTATANPYFSFQHGHVGGGQRHLLPLPRSPEEEAQILSEQQRRLFLSALDEFPQQFNKILDDIFPVAIHMTKILDRNKKRVNRIRIDAGSAMGVEKGKAMRVVTYTSYDALGETFVRKDYMGWYYPTEIEEHTSEGILSGGRKDAANAVDAGKKIFIEHFQ